MARRMGQRRHAGAARQSADAIATKLQQWRNDPEAAAASGHAAARFAAILEPETLRALADHYGTAQ